MENSAPVRVGRPRAVATETALNAREQILDAAAALFVQNGFAATTTRAIADRVGIRQASLYYHFAGKEAILAELLGNTVRPALTFVRELEAGDHSPAAALHALASLDAGALLAAPHNVGTLYLLPEVTQPRYDTFHDDRTRLRDAYGRWGLAAASPEIADSGSAAELGDLLIHLVEFVISARRNGTPARPSFVAASCLRACGLTSAQITAAAREAGRDGGVDAADEGDDPR